MRHSQLCTELKRVRSPSISCTIGRCLTAIVHVGRVDGAKRFKNCDIIRTATIPIWL